MSTAKGYFFSQFFRRVNRDSTIDSICGHCFLTAATAENEADLRARESLHVCYAEADSKRVVMQIN